MRLDEADPKGLVRESYQIEGISDAECRSIFIDWALSLKPGVDSHDALRVVLAEYAGDAAHPMTRVLTAALVPPQTPPRRRGGRASRVGG
ncbi:MAG: hypothetical protein JXR75_07625 [Rhodobacteraceae bacterium]|nr:hypothetical protein [Paracoccaceae bacterium]